jgi:hypothetical protein
MLKQTVQDHRVGLARAGIQEVPDVYGDSAMVRTLVREALVAGGLGLSNPDSPFSDIVAPGAFVLLKPNWVLHFNHSGATMDCMITHPAFIEAVVAEVATVRPARILIADAPIQSARFDMRTCACAGSCATPRVLWSSICDQTVFWSPSRIPQGGLETRRTIPTI